MKGKCLFCYNELDTGIDFHEKCSRKFFSTNIPPELEVTLSGIENLALKNLGRSLSVTGVQPKLSLEIERS